MGIILPSRKSITNFYINGDVDRNISEVELFNYNPSISTNPQAVNYNDKVYFFSDTYMYEFNGKTFTRCANLPIGWNVSYADQTTSRRARFIACNKGIAMVGCYVIPTTAHLWNGSTWSSLPSLKVSQSGNCGVFFNGQLYALGSDDEGYATRQYTYDTTSGTEWNWSATLPFKARYSDAVVYNNEIHIFGGEVSTYAEPNTNHYVYDGSTWSQSTAIPETFSTSYGRAIVYNNKIYLLGCAGGKKTWIWDNGSWVAGNDLLTTMSGDVAFLFHDEIFRAGGGVGNKFRSYEHQLVGYKMT